MSAFNRAFISILAIAWCAALGACLILIWDQNRGVALDWSNLNLGFDIFADTQAEQILATIVAGVLALPALVLLALEIVPQGRSEAAIRQEARTKETQSRADSLQSELEDERKRREAAEKQLEQQRGRRESAEKDVIEQRERAERVRDTSSPGRRWHILPGARH